MSSFFFACSGAPWVRPSIITPSIASMLWRLRRRRRPPPPPPHQTSASRAPSPPPIRAPISASPSTRPPSSSSRILWRRIRDAPPMTPPTIRAVSICSSDDERRRRHSRLRALRRAPTAPAPFRRVRSPPPTRVSARRSVWTPPARTRAANSRPHRAQDVSERSRGGFLLGKSPLYCK